MTKNIIKTAVLCAVLNLRLIFYCKRPEAIMQMELSGHDFYIYTDEETDSISVVYIRKDGSYGLIETK